MRFIIIALLVLSPAAARADGKLEAGACERLSAAYVAGVDAYGRAVVPADLGEQPVKMPETFSFDITVDAAKASGLPVPDGVEMQAKVGTVTYDKGALSFNGKPLQPEQEAKLRDLCPAEEEQKKNDED